MFFSYTSYYLAIAAISLALAVTLFFCYPLFITILSVLFLDEKMDKKGWTALSPMPQWSPPLNILPSPSV
jgi:drug/metabolite transporter (DMT)-like permease